MKSVYFTKLSALLLVILSVITSIYSLKIKKSEKSQKVITLNSPNTNSSDKKVYTLSEKFDKPFNIDQNFKNLNIDDTLKQEEKIEYKMIPKHPNKNSFGDLLYDMEISKIPKEFSFRIQKNYFGNSISQSKATVSNSNSSSDSNISNNKEQNNQIDKSENKYSDKYQDKSNKINSNLSNNISKIVINPNKKSDAHYQDSPLKKFVIGISIYWQLFLILCTVSFLKLTEESFKTMIIYCENKYSLFKDLNEENKNQVLSNRLNYVFCAGNPIISEVAHDDIFDFSKEKKYAKIERIVEIYKPDEKCWKILGKKAIKNNHSYSTEANQPDVIEDMDEYEIGDKFKLEMNSQEDIYTFPKIFSKTFIGKAYLYNIQFSKCQIESLKNYENIEFPKNDEFINKFIDELKKEKHITKNFIFKRENKSFLIYPLEEQTSSDDNKWKMRIHMRGYTFTKISLLGQIHKEKFRTIHIPFSPETLERTNDSFEDINLSLGMITKPNLQFDLCNLFFCMCFSGPVIYSQNDEIMTKDDINIGKINWIEEEIYDKASFVFKKHRISHISLHISRIGFLVILTILFYYLPNPTPMFSRMFHLANETIEYKYFLRSFLFAKALTLITILYAKISIKIKHCFNIFILTTFAIFLVVYAIWEIVYLAES